jgi:DNA-binding MarR family transcriptional regulator
MDQTALDAHTLFMTHTQVDRWLRLQIGRALEATNLTMMEWLLLMSVRKHAKKGLTITGVAELLGVSLPQVTALTQQLLKKQLLTQQIERQDRRSRRLCISAKGEKLSDQALHEVELLLNDLSEAPEVRGYKHLLTRLVDRPPTVLQWNSH